MQDQVDIGGVFEYLRSKKGLSARAVSLQAGLSPSYLNKVEAGALLPSFQAFCQIAKTLEMTDAEVVLVVRMYQEM